MITKQKKEETLKELKADFKNAKSVVFVNFHGVTVKMASDLRKLLSTAGAKYFVAKKTLIQKAVESAGFEGTLPKMEGEISAVFSGEDIVSPARIIAQFAKKNKVLKFVGGIFESKCVGAEKAIAIASIPPREILLGQLINIINYPIQGLVVALNARVKKSS